MKIQNLFGIVCVGTAVAACGGGGGGGGGTPASITFTAPSFLTTGQATPALSADTVRGISNNAVNLTLNPDGSMTFDLPGDSFTIDSTEIVFSDAGIGFELFEFASPTGTPNQPDFVELVILKDALDNDLIALARIDQLDVTGFGYETSAVVGDATDPATIGTGNATYTGFVIGTLLINGALPAFDVDGEYDFVEGDVTVDADFATDNVILAFTNFSIPNPTAPGEIALPGIFSGTATIGANSSQYIGVVSGSLQVPNSTVYALDGALNGGFFGAVDNLLKNPEATAGTLNMDEVGGAGTAEFVGNFAAN